MPGVRGQAHHTRRNSSSDGKLTAVSSETSRWRSVLQRKATVNFNVREDEEV